MPKIKSSGFTLIELLVVIAIMGVLTTLAVIALGNARVKARDSKRVADLKQISTALELYYNDNGAYPAIITSGQSLISPDGLITYMAIIPSNPTPREDNGCPNADYTYTPINDNTSYTLDCCIGTNVSELTAGTVTYTPSGWSVSGGGSFTCGNVITDVDSNTYNTVQIGTQCWMKENLNTGTMTLGANNQANDSVIEKYCYSDNTANCTTYGGLYQWHEAMALPASCMTTTCSIQTPHQGICPTGWHIPTDAEANTLDQYLTSSGQTCNASRIGVWDCADAGGKLKEAGTTHWSSQTCGSATCNSSGFTALGAGYRATNGSFYNLTSVAYVWQASQYSATNGWSRYLYATYSTVYRYANNKAYGYSVRCLKD